MAEAFCHQSNSRRSAGVPVTQQRLRRRREAGVPTKSKGKPDAGESQKFQQDAFKTGPLWMKLLNWCGSGH
jgi:hypothetical protein